VSIVTINNASSNDMAAMVRDILAIHVSSIALENIFSTRVRVLDTYRSSLGLKVENAVTPISVRVLDTFGTKELL
jgi:hypothetical protein